MSAEAEDYEEYVESEVKPVDAVEQKKYDFLSSPCSFRGSYAAIHTSGFRDFLLKAELLQAIADAGFEHPSEVWDWNMKVGR